MLEEEKSGNCGEKSGNGGGKSGNGGGESGRWLEGFSLGELEKGDGGEIITTSIPIANTRYM